MTESFLFFVVCYDEWLSSVGRDVGLVDSDEGLVADVVAGGEAGILTEDDLVVEKLHLTASALSMGAEIAHERLHRIVSKSEVLTAKVIDEETGEILRCVVIEDETVVDELGEHGELFLDLLPLVGRSVDDVDGLAVLAAATRWA